MEIAWWKKSTKASSCYYVGDAGILDFLMSFWKSFFSMNLSRNWHEFYKENLWHERSFWKLNKSSEILKIINEEFPHLPNHYWISIFLNSEENRKQKTLWIFQLDFLFIFWILFHHSEALFRLFYFRTINLFNYQIISYNYVKNFVLAGENSFNLFSSEIVRKMHFLGVDEKKILFLFIVAPLRVNRS